MARLTTESGRRVQRIGSALGVAKRDPYAHPDEIKRLEKELRAEQLLSHVEKTLAKFGPFTPEQIARIAALLTEAV